MTHPLRIIWSDISGIHNLTDPIGQELTPGTYALVGPLESHMAEPELQDALGLVALRRNRRFGHLSFGKFIAFLRRDKLGRRYVR